MTNDNVFLCKTTNMPLTTHSAQNPYIHIYRQLCVLSI